MIFTKGARLGNPPRIDTKRGDHFPLLFAVRRHPDHFRVAKKSND